MNYFEIELLLQTKDRAVVWILPACVIHYLKFSTFITFYMVRKGTDHCCFIWVVSDWLQGKYGKCLWHPMTSNAISPDPHHKTFVTLPYSPY